LVVGEAGIGKTALIRSFQDGLNASVRVLWAACEPLFTPRPLGPLLDVARLTDGEVRECVEAGAQPHVVADALIRELAGRAPTVLVLEDLHWADEATLDVVRILSRRLEALRALIVVSYRDDELDRLHPLRQVVGQLPSRGPVTRVELAGLSRSAVARLSEGSSVDPRELFERTAGNPFFVTEALATGLGQVPGTIRDAVLARAARLSDEARALLDAVAVVPHEAEIWLLNSLTASRPGALDDCLSSGMLRAGPTAVAFRHELARLAVEESLAPDWRVALHRRALEAWGGQGFGAPDLARVAHHAEAAGDVDAVLRFAPAAAEHAASVGAHREAADQYARALRFATGLQPDARAEILQRFADECFLTDTRNDQALAALDEAFAIHRRSGDPVKLGETQRLRAGLLLCGAGHADEAESALREAIDYLEQVQPGPELARSYAGLSELLMRASRGDAAISWGRKAIDLAEQTGDTAALVQGLSNIGTVEFERGSQRGLEMLERSLALGEQAGLATEVGRVYVNLLAVLTQRGAWALSDSYRRRGIAHCREHGLDAWLGYMLWGEAEIELVRGHFTEAAEAASGLLAGPSAESRIGPRFGGLVTLALVRARRGDPGSWPLLDEALKIAERLGELQYLTPIAAARAEAAWLERRPEAIVTETDRAFALACELGQPVFLGELALWRWRAGVLAEPPAGTEELYRRQIAGEWEWAATAWSERECVYEAALALADAPDNEALRRAFDQLSGLGALTAAALVARRLRERGVRGLPRGPRSGTRANPAGLTARELELLPLMIQGLRNSEIADCLIVSSKTVDHHMSAIFRKLDVRNRSEAAAAAIRLGIEGANSETGPTRPSSTP
jgi:DNA-binding CsgD family transcriptional regulator/tetratricopeptide (TPR) repeat protein